MVGGEVLKAIHDPPELYTNVGIKHEELIPLSIVVNCKINILVSPMLMEKVGEGLVSIIPVEPVGNGLITHSVQL